MKLAAALGALLCIALALPQSFRAARAESARLALVLAPRSDDAALVEVSARVRGELSAAGFRVVTREARAGASPERAVVTAGADLSPSAVLWIVAAQGHTQAAPSLEIWLSDRLLGKVSMARLSGASAQNETPKVLAVQAVELLRARMSELRVGGGAPEPEEAEAWVEKTPPPAAPADPPARDDASGDPRSPATRDRAWLGVSLGLGYLFGSGTLAGALMPVLGATVGLGEPRAGALPLSCDLRVSAGAFGQRARLRAPGGSAEVAQAFGDVSAALRFVPRIPLEPFAALGLGVYTLGVRGAADAPLMAHDARYWAPTGTASLGLRSRPFAHLSLLAATEYVQAFSRAEVYVGSTLAGRAGGAMWRVRAELVGVF